MTQNTAPTEMTREHARILKSYDRDARGERTPVLGFLIDVAAILLLTPIGFILFALGWTTLVLLQRWGIAAPEPLPAAVLFAVVTVFVWQAWEQHRGAGSSRALREGIAADRRAGQVEEERHAIAEARVLREPVHGGRILLVRTEEDRVFATYDFSSFVAPEDDGAETEVAARREMRIVRFPASGLEEVVFDGEAVPTRSPLVMETDPEDWPVDGAWWDVEWEAVPERVMAA